MSKLFQLTSSDAVKGLVMAVIGAVLTFLEQFFATGANFTAIDWLQVLNVALVAGIGYLVKNFFSDKDGAVVTPFGKIGK